MKETPVLSGPGQGECTSPIIPHPADSQPIDQRLAFLACAAARLMLVEEGCMTIDEAFDPPFVETFRFLGRLTCYCDLERMKAFDRIHRQMRERELQDWRFSSPPKQEKPRPAASTIDAYRYVVKQGDPERLRAWLERHPEIKPEEHS